MIPYGDIIDIHAHILPGLDDGPKTLEESLELARCYTRLGIGKVICTPHFIPGTAWAAARELVLEKIAAVQEYFRDNDVNLTLFPGMEIAFHKKLRERLENGQLMPLAESSRFLVEPSFSDSADELLDMLEVLVGRGYGIILAHPERIPAIQEMTDSFAGFAIENGVSIQVNSGSLLGKFGSDSHLTAMQFIDRGCIQYVASDAHGVDARRPPDETEWLELERIVGVDLLRRWCCSNPAELLGLGGDDSAGQRPVSLTLY